MKKFEWSSQYCVGVEEIDNDHKKLLSILNMSIEAINQPDRTANNTATILDKITIYIQKHFRREEIAMEVCKYPHIINHKAAHTSLIDHVDVLIQDVDNNQLSAEELTQFLINWLVEHITEIDYHLAAYCVGKEKLITEALKHIPFDEI